MNISVFPNATTPQNVKIFNINEVFNWIKSGKYKSDIDIIRAKHSALSELKKDSKDYIRVSSEKDAAKKQLPSIVFQGVFSYRAKHGLTEHSEIATLDFDHVKDPVFFRNHIFDNYKFVNAAFISPSGDGVKIVVRIPKVNNDTEYKEYYKVLLEYFDDAKSDESTKDISRICFISYDPDILIRKWSDTSVFKQNKSTHKKQVENAHKIVIKNKDKSLEIAAKMIRNSVANVDMHFCLLKASRLLGGYVEGKTLDYNTAVKLLVDEIQKKPIKSLDAAKKTIESGLKYGAYSPLNRLPSDNYEKPLTATIDILKSKTLQFPVDVFPDDIQKLIKELNRCLSYPVEFTASGLLTIFSTIIRNSIKVQPMPGYIDTATVWLMQIGDPGTSKTYPLKTLYNPLENIEAALIDDFKNQFDEYTTEKENDNNVKKPKQKELIIRDFTIESLGKTLENNPAGVGLYIDELKTWIEGMGKYNGGKSNDIQTWLSIFGSSSIKIGRKTQDIPIYIKSPFVSIAGTIQPDELMDVNRKHSSNGFFDRFLFVYPNLKMEKRTRMAFDTNLIDQYNDNIVSIFNVYNDLIKENILIEKDYIVSFDDEAQELYYLVDDWLVDTASNSDTNAALNSYFSKLRTYLPRLSLIMEVITCAFNGYIPDVITKKSVQNAAKLLRYFYYNGELVYNKFNEAADVNTFLNNNKNKSKQDQIYELFTTGIAIKQIAKQFKIAESTVRVNISRAKKR